MAVLNINCIFQKLDSKNLEVFSNVNDHVHRVLEPVFNFEVKKVLVCLNTSQGGILLAKGHRVCEHATAAFHPVALFSLLSFIF